VVNLSGGGEPSDEPRAVGSTQPERSSEELERRPSKEREAEQLPVVSSDDWPSPSDDEVAATQGPRYYPPVQDAQLTLTIAAIGLYDVPVISSNSEEALDNGVIHVPQTPMPWEERPQKNVYLAGHRLGYPDTGSRLVFYNLDKLSGGDTVALRDRSGTVYEYRVSEVFVVEPDADWVVDPVRGRDMVTLQTCTFPTFENRLIVRADHAGHTAASGDRAIEDEASR
jgi:sortase A